MAKSPFLTVFDKRTNKQNRYYSWKYSYSQNNTKSFVANLEWEKESLCKIFMQYNHKYSFKTVLCF